MALWKISGEAVCRNNTCTCADLHERVWEQRGEECADRRGDGVEGDGSEQWGEHQQMSSSFIRLRIRTFVITVAVTLQTTLHQTASGGGCWAPGAAGQDQKLSVLDWWTLCLSFVGASVPECGLSSLHLLYQRCSTGGQPEELSYS